MTSVAEIPYGAYWSTPFARWQGGFANLHAIRFAAHVATAELTRRELDPGLFDHAVLGLTIPQRHSFYGVPWLMGLIGNPGVTGPTIAQACATGARSLLAAVHEIQAGSAGAVLVMTCDRTSNGPHLYYPDPGGPGGKGASEDWVLDNFTCDPAGPHAMVDTAENVARARGISTAEQHDIVLRRGEQYRAAMADDHAFHKRYMTLPFEVPSANFRKIAGTLDGDEGIRLSTEDGLAGLQPVRKGGTVTYAGQTHPADGSAAIVVTDAERARAMARDPAIAVRILGFGQARTDLAHMPEAIVPAARRALDRAGLGLDRIDAVNSHNPFAVNDIVFCRETGFDPMKMNNYGCSLIWGHPQGPTGTRAIIELIEELALRGGGRGLFQGCAAGDTAMAVVVEVADRGRS